MADHDWKKRLGIEISYNSDEDETHSEKQNDSSRRFPTFERMSSLESTLSDEKLADFDQYSCTPPRTRILRRQRERNQREKGQNSSNMKTTKVHTQKIIRRNTFDTICFNELIQKADGGNSDFDTSSRRSDKRSWKLLRESERDLKLDIGDAQSIKTYLESHDERAESMPIISPHQTKFPTLIETCNRFRSLTSRPVIAHWKKRVSRERFASSINESDDFPEDRIEFFKKFCSLVQCRFVDQKNQINEDRVWQNELQDLIWLELQARHADRTLKQQDAYLCAARESVSQLLQDIMKYRFVKNQSKNLIKSSTSTHSSDSGVGAECNLRNCTESLNESISESYLKSNCDTDNSFCAGCLSMYCKPCIDAQNEALREVEQLLEKLEAAEALFPSSKAFGEFYSLYKSSEFVGRVKAMCLWYNLMKHQRLKLLILGRLMMFLQGQQCRWPVALSELEAGMTCNLIHDHSSDDTANSDKLSRSSSLDCKDQSGNRRHICVQFDMDHSSPSDSNNSNYSNHDGVMSISNEEDYLNERVDYFNVDPITSLGKQFKNSSDVSPYRKYIENVLKTKGLRRALYFLEILQETVLRKAQITLERPPSGMSFEEYTGQKCQLKSTDDGYDIDECELRRYGYWSPEAQDLQLPSYRSAFLFLSLVPLEVVREFMRMRLEQKPNKPSPLSIRQLMRELKEGLRIAVLHRERILIHINTALSEEDPEYKEYKRIVEEFDENIKEVFEMYLEYVEQWSLMIQYESFQKNMLDEEWNFVKTTYNHVPKTLVFVGQKFSQIVSSILENIGTTLKSRVEELAVNINTEISNDDDFQQRQPMLFVCRKLQNLFDEERERSLKTLSFSRTLIKEFYCLHKADDNEPKSEICESLMHLKIAVLGLLKDLTEVIERVQEIFDVSINDDLDETDKNQLSSRCREILHQAFKFGFEYYREVSRITSSKLKPSNNSQNLIYFAKLWMHFVMERCERGRGQRPRWACQGIDFLTLVCEPQYTKDLNEIEFEELKSLMDECISHIIGTASTPSPEILNSSPRISHSRSRGSSPQPRSRTPSINSKHKELFSGARKESVEETTDELDTTSNKHPRRKTSNTKKEKKSSHKTSFSYVTAVRSERIKDAINRLEKSLDEKLHALELIGRITATHASDKLHMRSRCVNFSWQRGIKIGQGRFGKVYTAVNNATGEMLAMKEIPIQPNDQRSLKKIAEEIKIFEGISHVNLVRYYGVEIHREEMLIFMEFCPEGTLENLVAATENGLSEASVRCYTHQILMAIHTLHEHGIVHRDIKSANIFLTEEGNRLKVGDFGSAIKIKAHTTMPGELQGFVGTQAYMAPEVFMKTDSEGHGRAADIWSLGCVVVEMASGKRPWEQYDSNYQIMFVVGMGETPAIPEQLSEEGKQFLDCCLQHDSGIRSTARELMHHNFLKVDDIYLS